MPRRIDNSRVCAYLQGRRSEFRMEFPKQERVEQSADAGANTRESSVQPNRASLRTLGRYEIQEELGRGAMGAVYKAFDPVIARTDITTKRSANPPPLRRLKQAACMMPPSQGAAQRISFPRPTFITPISRGEGSLLTSLSNEQLSISFVVRLERRLRTQCSLVCLRPHAAQNCFAC